MNNIFEDIPNKIPEELFEILFENKSIKIERIVSFGHTTPENEWYDQTKNEWVILLSGASELLFEDSNEALKMEPGQFIFIPAHKKHRVIYTAEDKESVWLAIHFE